MLRGCLFGSVDVLILYLPSSSFILLFFPPFISSIPHIHLAYFSHQSHLAMDLPWKKKPSLPRLATNLPKESKSDPSLSLRSRTSNEIRAKPRPEHPVHPPSPYPEQYENIPPAIRYAPDPKILYITKDPAEMTEAKKRSQYYADMYATRPGENSSLDRATQDSVVIVELKTNCKVCLLYHPVVKYHVA